MQRLLIAGPLALALLLGGPAGRLHRPCLAAELTLEDLIELVRQNEPLYERIDFTIRGRFRTFNREWMESLPPEKEGQVVRFRDVLAEDWELRVVYQSPYFRMDRAAKQAYIRNETKDLPFICAFDGEKTRMLIDAIGNVRNGFSIHNPFPQPHTLFIFEWMRLPLSAYLAGDKAMKGFPKERRPKHSLRASYKGLEVWNGLRCHLVHVIASAGGRDGGRTELWLAEERNYIPARAVDYQYWKSTEEPVGWGEVREWREIAPGVWFPSRITEEAYWIQNPHEPGKPDLNWQKEITLENVVLHPEYQRSFFQFEFPQGTAVYEIDDAGEIQQSYRVGTPEAPRVAWQASSRAWLTAVALAAILAVGVLVLVHRRRCARKAVAPAERT